MKWRVLAPFAACALALAGCGTLPASGPTAAAILDEQPENGPPAEYVVVDIDEAVVNTTGQYRAPSFSSFFRISDGTPEIQLAVGDEININIFEAGADGLFSSSTAKATQISAVIDQSGRVFVPYVGPVQAANRTPDALRATIEAALEDKAIQPQVQVLVARSLKNSVTLLGAVGSPGQQPVPVGGARVLDLVAAAGGATVPTYQAQVILRRGETVATAALEDLFDSPEDNVPVRPGDTILLSDEPRSYTVFGATAERSEVPFEGRKVTLAEGIARAGGLDDSLADASGVFLFRFEPDQIAKALDERATVAPEGSMVPVVYRLNLKEPNSFFLAKAFELRDEDILFVANSPSTQLSKFLQLVAPVVSTTTTVATLTQRLGGSN